MSQFKRMLQARTIQDTTLRRLRNTPSYFFLIWRWTWWLYAFIVIVSQLPSYTNPPAHAYELSATSAKLLAAILLTTTFLQTLIVTLYAPIFQILIPRLPGGSKLFPTGKKSIKKPKSHYMEEEAPDILTPLIRTRNLYWDIAIYGGDVFLCGLAMYFGGAFSAPPFGVGSPFYRYGFAAIYASALAYRYRGGLAAALGYDLFAILGMIISAPGTVYYTTSRVDSIINIAGSLVDAPIAAILTAYLSTLIANYARSKRREQTNVRRQKALLNVGATILREIHDRQQLLQRTAEQLRQGGHFERLIIALVGNRQDGEGQQQITSEVTTCVEVNVPDTLLLERNPAYLEQVMSMKKKLVTFETFNSPFERQYGIARLYLPLLKEGQIQMIIGAENIRQAPFDRKQEDFLTIAGRQLLVALENITLTEQTIQLAATAERRRIAREIHDGIAQLTYMLSLNAETCATQAHRIVEASEEDAELITPLAQRLDKLVAVSKQALWETRNYMFSLKPLMSGTTTLTQMLTNQLREFETISDLPVQLEVEGTETFPVSDHKQGQAYAQIGAAIFRIVQEALTNAYKHAEATQLYVSLQFASKRITVCIRDNGKGIGSISSHSGDAPDETQTRIYSGHGLRGMRERAEELGGTFQISSIATGGTQIQVCIPL